MDCKEIQVRHDLPRMQEVFTGCNRVRYKHVYLMACSRHHHVLSPPSSNPPSSSSSEDEEDGPAAAAAAAASAPSATVQDVVLQGDRGQLREVSRVCWMSAADVEARIRSYNPERKRMFLDAHALVLRLRPHA